MTDQLSVPAHDGVDGTQLPRQRRQFIQIGDDRLLVGNGHIDAGKAFTFQKSFNFFRLLFKYDIGIVPKPGVNLRGIAVPQLPAQKSALHHTTSQ